MKNLIAVITLTFLLLPLTVNSQFLSGFGVKGGATVAKQKIEFKFGPFDSGNKSILGFNAGLFVEMINNKTFNFVLEPGYEQRGYIQEIISTDEFGNVIGSQYTHFKTHYITIGALGKLKYEAGKVSPYLLIGPRIDLYTGYNVSFSGVALPPELEEVLKISPFHEQMKKVNYSISFGAGLQFEKLLPFKTLVEFNYSPAINSSLNNQAWLIKDHYFNFKLGINFIKEKTKKTKK